MPLTAGAADARRPGFTNMAEVVEFLGQCVQQNDLARFTNACISPSHAGAHVFDALKKVDAKTPLKEIYAGKQFPASSFTMGGHDKELGHINIPLLKTNGTWYIVDYFVCR
jgi:hypothetical protein